MIGIDGNYLYLKVNNFKFPIYSLLIYENFNSVISEYKQRILMCCNNRLIMCRNNRFKITLKRISIRFSGDKITIF